MPVPPAVLTAAICGAETTREQTPYLPITSDELATEAERCAQAGASVIHLHVRNDDGSPTQDRALFEKAIRAIRARCDVIVQTTTGGAVGMSADERAQPLLCDPEMATLNARSRWCASSPGACASEASCPSWSATTRDTWRAASRSPRRA